ncbi:unnamed protein product [Sympodiomycopsis kandeliae]
MISSLVWVRQGVSARHPVKFNITDEEELQRVQKLTQLEFGDAQAQLEEAKKEALKMGGDEEGWESDGDENEEVDMESEDKKEPEPAQVSTEDDEMAKYNLDNYDEEQSTGVAMGAFSNIRGLQFYKNNDDDPYITLKDDQQDDQEEREAMEILPSDNMLISAKTEDEVSMLEAHVYASDTVEGQDVAESSLFVHHDLLLPSFPLCLEAINHNISSSSKQEQGGNYIAVSTMEPEVEVWNMDVVDGLVPDVILGDRQASKDWEKQGKKKGTGKKKKKVLATRPISSQYHTDAVLSMSWNPFVSNLLLTSSADTTIKLWDLNAKPASHGGLEAIRSFQIHSDKVQSVVWNTSGTLENSAETDRSLVASGGYDGFIKIWDVRNSNDVISIPIQGEVEKLKWHPWKSNHILVALDSGLVQEYSILPNKQFKLNWTLSAHEQSCTSIDYSSHIKNCLITGSLDRTLKIWNVSETSTGKKEISLVASRDPGAGKIFTASFSPDDPLTIAVAGSTGKVKVWNALGSKGVRDVFGQQLKEFVKSQRLIQRQADKDGEGELVEVEEDEDEGDSEDGEREPEGEEEEQQEDEKMDE